MADDKDRVIAELTEECTRWRRIVNEYGREVVELRNQIHVLENRSCDVACVWCGYHFTSTVRSQAEHLYEHAKVCEKHPVRKLIEEVEELKAELRLRDISPSNAQLKKWTAVCKPPPLPHYQDERHCGHCQADTLHECRDSEHERDSSDDFQRCTVCRWYKTGHSRTYEPPIEPS